MLSITIPSTSRLDCPIAYTSGIIRIILILITNIFMRIHVSRIKTGFILIIWQLHQTPMRLSCNKKSNQWAYQDHAQYDEGRYRIKNNINQNTRRRGYDNHWDYKRTKNNIKPIKHTATFGCRWMDIFFLRERGFSSTLHCVMSCMNRFLMCIVRKANVYLHIIHHHVSICYKNPRGSHG